VAIISTLGVELDAIEGAFDEWDNENDRVIYNTTSGDVNWYAILEINNHPVVLAYMPGMGKAHGAAVAAGLRSSFPNIRLALLIGVCDAVLLPRFLSRRHHCE
jgi:nucleoside phosphorylase